VLGEEFWLAVTTWLDFLSADFWARGAVWLRNFLLVVGGLAALAAVISAFLDLAN
jgi:hypothetical protein